MHGPQFGTSLPTAFVAPALTRSTGTHPATSTPLNISPKLANANPINSPLAFQKPFPGRGLPDPRATLHLPPNLVSLRAHGSQTPETETDETPTDKTDQNSLTPETDGSQPADLVPAGDVETKEGFKNPLPGIQIGIPLNILASFFSTLRYGENMIGLDSAFLQACLGYLTYGTDRLLDAYTEKGEITPEKQALYDDIKKNTLPMVAAITAATAHAYNVLKDEPETRPFIPLLASTFAYKQLKENFGAVKPFYIAAMWTAACVVLPAVMHDGDFSILASPQDYLPAALLMFGSTNLADAKDIVEDKEKGIETLPVKLGRPVSDLISYAALGTAAIMIGSQVFGH